MSKRTFLPTSEIQTPVLLKPFGPTLGYHKLEKELIEYLNTSLDGVYIDPNAPDHGDYLAGMIESQPNIPHHHLEQLIRAVRKFMFAYAEGADLVQDHHEWKEGLHVYCSSAWYINQFKNEYNPLHMHPNTAMSCVGFLEIPDDLQLEWASDPDTMDGVLEFTHDTHCVKIRPRVGDFFIFPGTLNHVVYPFRCGGNRRSFSMNFDVIKGLKYEA